jgi:hypothetical protein
VTVQLYGARREVHDWHAGAGSFDAALRALAGAEVCTPITRSNARVLSELPSLLQARGATSWVLLLPTHEEAKVRLGMAIPSALAALDRAQRLGLDARIAGVPLCVLGPYAASALPTPPRAYGQRCAACAARSRCPGVDAAYLELFGESELHPLER